MNEVPLLVAVLYDGLLLCCVNVLLVCL